MVSSRLRQAERRATAMSPPAGSPWLALVCGRARHSGMSDSVKELAKTVTDLAAALEALSAGLAKQHEHGRRVRQGHQEGPTGQARRRTDQRQPHRIGVRVSPGRGDNTQQLQRVRLSQSSVERTFSMRPVRLDVGLQQVFCRRSASLVSISKGAHAAASRLTRRASGSPSRPATSHPNWKRPGASSLT